jgi:hypothetical protein
MFYPIRAAVTLINDIGLAILSLQWGKLEKGRNWLLKSSITFLLQILGVAVARPWQAVPQRIGFLVVASEAQVRGVLDGLCGCLGGIAHVLYTVGKESRS